MLTESDKALLNALQTGLPICEEPFAVLGEELHLTGEEVIQRLQELKAAGYIRRIGPFFDSEKLGYKGALVAVQVCSEKIGEVAAFINQYSCITHNYEREHLYNLWFTIMTPSLVEREHILTNIREREGVESILVLPSLKKYKISVQFTL